MVSQPRAEYETLVLWEVVDPVEQPPREVVPFDQQHGWLTTRRSIVLQNRHSIFKLSPAAYGGGECKEEKCKRDKEQRISLPPSVASTFPL